MILLQQIKKKRESGKKCHARNYGALLLLLFYLQQNKEG
jgi:hypothetical protein